MANAVIGALRVHLGLDTAQFNQGLKTSKAGLGDWAKTAKIGAAAVVTTMITTASAVGVAIKGMIDEADKMSKMSQQIGIPIGELSRLKYAAELSDVSLEQLGRGVKRLSATMMEIAQGGTGPAARAFEMLGIKAQEANGSLRPASQVIADLSTKFAAMDDGATKTALAMNIFGKSGADLIPLLNSGGEGLREMYQEAEELGLVLDAKTGKAAEAFNDNLTRLGAVKDGIIQKIGAGMLPALEQLSAALVGSSKNTKLMEVIGNALGWTLKALVSVVAVVGAAFIGVASDIGAAYDAAARFVKFDFKGGAKAFEAGRSRTETMLRGTETFVKSLWATVPAGQASARATNDAGMAIEDYSKKASKGAKATKELTDAEREAKQAAEDLAREGKRIFDATRTPLEKHEETLKNLIRLFKEGAISGDTFKRAMQEARQTLEATDDPIGRLLREGEDAARESARDEHEKLRGLADDARKQLEDATYDGIKGGLYAAADGNLGRYLASRLQEYLFDGLANALTQAVQGAGGGGGSGFLRQMFSAGMSFFGGGRGAGHELAHFKTGGSFKVGGSGGADSQLMQFMASPGEMVDIRRPGQMREATSVRVIVEPNDDRFNAYVDDRAAPMAARAYSAAVSQARRDAPGAVSQAQRQGRG